MRVIVCRFAPIAFIMAGLALTLIFMKGAPVQEATETAGEISAIELPPAATGEVDFERDIWPILRRNCFKCHGPGQARSGLRLHMQDLALQGGDNGPVIVPGDSAASRLIRLVAGLEDIRMPFEGDPLTREQVGLLRAWIDQGARWRQAKGDSLNLVDHWSFQPIPHPKEPVVANREWVRNPIDALVLARLKREGIQPSPEADRSTLIRRLYLDLLGLPPSPAEWAAFMNDRRPYAYERLVTRLLASPHFGERWARHWLDLARYADSDGFEKDGVRPHAWRYREWVIDAYNRDMPYDQFVVEQLAGDLLPNATTEQRVATGFHRNTLTNREGGVDQEQFRVEQVVDRTNTTGLVFMGLTVGCAQCHTHKYDPITHREYYRMFAFFNTAMERDIAAPLDQELVTYRRAKALWDGEHEQLVGAAEEYKKRLSEELAEKGAETLAKWEAGLDYRPVQWTTLDPASYSSAGGATFTKQAGGALLAGGNNPNKDTYTIVANTLLKGITAFRLEVLTDESLPNNGPGRADDGNFVLSDFKVKASPMSDPTKARELTFKRALSDHSQDGFHVSNAIDSDLKTGWAVNGPEGPNHDRQAIFILNRDIGHEGGTTLAFTMEHRYGSRHNLGWFRVSVTTANRENLNQVLPLAVEAVLATPREERTDEQKAVLLDYCASQDARVRELLAAVEGHNKAKPPAPGTMAQTMAENPEPPKTYIHIRGDFLRKGQQVQPNALSVLPPLSPRGDKPDRLDLARWIVDPAHPLTARVEVNRLWERLFGRGLVATSKDFGTRGEKPSHPQLLDWLATEFIRGGWSRKGMIKLIVTSSTYRQASAVRPELTDRDPKNILLARQNRFRVQSEITRDLFLSVGGLLEPRIGGPSIRPPLPSDIADLGYANSVRWSESSGTDKYRRGLYIFFQRTVPYPMLVTFDSPDSNTSCVRRTRSNTPLQALTLLNDPVFVECAQSFGKRVMEEGPKGEIERIRYAFRLALAREPSEAELALLVELLADQRKVFEKDLENADQFVGPYVPEDARAPEAAAWVAVGRMIMNLDEFLTRE